MSNHIQARTGFFIVSQLSKTVNLFLRFILILLSEKVDEEAAKPLTRSYKFPKHLSIEQTGKFCRPVDAIVL